jgi:Na+-translocating ferredoxin:NAD+ oxidoreductase RNF subunit RnfB
MRDGVRRELPYCARLEETVTDYVRAVRAPDTTFRACGFRGCTSFASHVLYAGSEALCFCCGQCAAAALRRLRNDETVRGIEQVKIVNRMAELLTGGKA